MIKFLLLIIICELLWVGWVDLKTKKISNLWSLVHVLIAAAFYLTNRDTYPFTWEVVVFPFGILLVGFFLYLINIMGAGDSKFLASLFLVIPIDFQLLFLKKLILSTIVTGAILLTFRAVKSWPSIQAYIVSRYWRGLRGLISSRFSYAPVICLGWILFGLELWK